jgi:hypothetical protein
VGLAFRACLSPSCPLNLCNFTLYFEIKDDPKMPSSMCQLSRWLRSGLASDDRSQSNAGHMQQDIDLRQKSSKCEQLLSFFSHGLNFRLLDSLSVLSA